MDQRSVQRTQLLILKQKEVELLLLNTDRKAIKFLAKDELVSQKHSNYFKDVFQIIFVH